MAWHLSWYAENEAKMCTQNLLSAATVATDYHLGVIYNRNLIQEGYTFGQNDQVGMICSLNLMWLKCHLSCKVMGRFAEEAGDCPKGRGRVHTG
jgi:hypothetical protein